MPNFKSIGSVVSEPQMAENRYLPLTCDITALPCYTVMVLESQCMLRMSSGSNTGVQTLPPLVNCIVNDALLHISPHVNQTSLQVIHILDFCQVDTLLHYAPDFVVNWV